MSARQSSEKGAPQRSGFEVAGWIDLLGGILSRHGRLWRKLGDLETRLIGDAVGDVAVREPVYIAGLARSGSTILLETLARHPAVATHRYRDFPPLCTPYLWNRWLDVVPLRDEQAAERSHKDGILVTSESPEAFEEVLWMNFFPREDAPSATEVLDRSTSNPAFEAFYRDHLRKLIAVRGAVRYVAKGNYNLTRLAYLQKIFPDARFLVPVRDPVWHIASLMKQQALFVAGQKDNPRARRHLARVGHFEFGMDRRAIHTGDERAIREVMALWAAGEELLGWARYWSAIHHYVADTLERDPDLRDACLVVRYEDLCARPRQAVAEILHHCDLAAEDAFLDAASERLHAPGYYRPRFSDAEMASIARMTDAAAARFGYAPLTERSPAGGAKAAAAS